MQHRRFFVMLNIKFIYFLGLLLMVSTSCGAATLPQTETKVTAAAAAVIAATMSPVSSVEQVIAQFGGKVVAYTAKSYNLYPSDCLYPLTEDNPIRFAHITTVFYGSFNMSRFIKKDGVASGCIADDSILKEESVCMRLATPEEIKLIDDALATDKAKFEYRWIKSVSEL
jgi:hypothetical protein